jgi:hypothetical protein
MYICAEYSYKILYAYNQNLKLTHSTLVLHSTRNTVLIKSCMFQRSNTPTSTFLSLSYSRNFKQILVTYSMEQSPPDKLVKKFSTFYGTQRFITKFTSAVTSPYCKLNNYYYLKFEDPTPF